MVGLGTARTALSPGCRVRTSQDRLRRLAVHGRSGLWLFEVPRYSGRVRLAESLEGAARRSPLPASPKKKAFGIQGALHQRAGRPDPRQDRAAWDAKSDGRGEADFSASKGQTSIGAADSRV